MSEPGTGVAYAVGPTARPPVPPLARAAQDSLARANRALLIVGCLVVLSISHGVDADLWGHVRYGQDELAARALPSTATHTYTAVGHPWINHENLAELAFGWIETHLGAAGLNAFNTLLGFLVLGLMVRNAVRQRVSFLVLSVAILLATCAIGPGWSIRPQLFTYTFFALLVVILGRCFRVGSLAVAEAAPQDHVLRAAGRDPGALLPRRRETRRARPVARAAAVRTLGQHARRLPRGSGRAGPLLGLPRARGAAAQGAERPRGGGRIWPRP